jgi:RimJ/RimL family protein N-acetyltransferase
LLVIPEGNLVCAFDPCFYPRLSVLSLSPMPPTNLQLVTDRLILRPVRESDRVPYAAMNADPAVMAYFAATMTAEESDASLDRFQAAYDRDGFGFLAAELRATGAFAGIIGAQTMRDVVPNLPQPAVEIGWRLPHAFHGQGLATEGARATVDFCFHTLNLPEVVAVTALGNRASRHVMEKLNMTHRPDLDFDHPRMPPGHPHQRHTLYQLHNPNPNAPQRTTDN